MPPLKLSAGKLQQGVKVPKPGTFSEALVLGDVPYYSRLDMLEVTNRREKVGYPKAPKARFKK